MTSTELIGWVAASLTLLAFNSRDVRLLRLASVAASVAFITYGSATSTWPVLALHCVLLPLNLLRLLELHRRGRQSRVQSPSHPASVPVSSAASCACGRTRAASSRWRSVLPGRLNEPLDSRPIDGPASEHPSRHRATVDPRQVVQQRLFSDG